METKSFYILNDNLDLPGENFIVKKGTFVDVIDVYNQKDETIPTMIGVHFENINGNYLVDSTSFDELIKTNRLQTQLAQFNIGDCVKNDRLGKGVVESFFF